MDIFKIIVLIFGFVLFTFASDEDEFYCRIKEENYRICRRCRSTDGPCPQELDECQCENIEAYNSETQEYYGGSDCETKPINETIPPKKIDFCYVSKLLNSIQEWLTVVHIQYINFIIHKHLLTLKIFY